MSEEQAKYGKDFEKTKLIEMTAKYFQEEDTLSDGLGQEIEISAVSSDFKEFYFVIKTERWAINDIDEMIELLNDFKSRLEISKQKHEES
jgi:hypothetical protein